MTDLLRNNVIPLYFESQDQIIIDRLGTGFIIGTIGKFILVATALHLFDDIEGQVKYLDGSKKMNLPHIPPNEDEKLETKNIGHHEIVGYITINENGEQVKCFMDGIFGANQNSSDVSLIAMRIDHDEYEHQNSLTIKLTLSEKDIGTTAYIYSFSNHETHMVNKYRKLYKTTAKLNQNSGAIISVYDQPKKDIETPSFNFNAISNGGNSGGLIYQLDNKNNPIACGIISRSSSDDSTSNQGNGYTVGVQFAHLMRYGYKICQANDNPLLNINKMPYVLGFVVAKIIKIVESHFLISIDETKKIGVELKRDQYIPISENS